MCVGMIPGTLATKTVALRMSLRWNGHVMDVAVIGTDPIHRIRLAQTADGQLQEPEMMVVLEFVEATIQGMAVFQLPEIQQLPFACVKKQSPLIAQ